MCANELCLLHTVLLHNAEELDDDLGRWSDEDLSLSGLLGVVDGIERIVLYQNVRKWKGVVCSWGRHTRTEVLTIFAVGDSQIVKLDMRYLQKLDVSLHGL